MAEIKEEVKEVTKEAVKEPKKNTANLSPTLVEEPKGKVVLITLNDYCNRLGTDGANKFAGPFIEARLREKELPNIPRTYEEWEGFHNDSLI